MFSLFNQSFYHDFFAVFSCFSVVFSQFYLLVSSHKTAVVLGAEMKWIASTLCKVCIHSWHAVALDFLVDLLFIQ